MLALLQRVNHAAVRIDGEERAAIGAGILALVGLEADDTPVTAAKLLDKIIAYRMFADAQGKMNLSLRDRDGELLLVSQFTLTADTGRGLRPGFSRGMAPAEARVLYEALVALAKGKHARTQSGVFGADMQVALENDGPVTFMMRASA